MAPVTGSVVIGADAQHVFGILLDVAAYPTWLEGFEKVDVVQTDAQGRPELATWYVVAMGQRTSYTVRFSYPADYRYEYHLDKSEVTTTFDFTCAVTPADDGTTGVEVSQEVALRWPMPKRILEKMARKGIDGLLAALKTRAES
jgi:ribosome-associated toxin RatA of RatAB toxin-antitoxin module